MENTLRFIMRWYRKAENLHQYQLVTFIIKIINWTRNKCVSCSEIYCIKFFLSSLSAWKIENFCSSSRGFKIKKNFVISRIHKKNLLN
jgi:hypothetical protein